MMIAANIISMTILFAVPLLLVAMGGMFSEHSGVINIALEGMMIIGALLPALRCRVWTRAVSAPCTRSCRCSLPFWWRASPA